MYFHLVQLIWSYILKIDGKIFFWTFGKFHFWAIFNVFCYFWTFLSIWAILSNICVGYQYQRFGMSFGVKPIYSQHWIDPATLSAKKIKIRKIGFLADFGSHRKSYIMPLKYLKLVKNYAYKWKIRDCFSSTRSQRVLIGFSWLLYEKASILTGIKGCKISFLISVDLTPLWYPECLKCISSQNW